MNAISSTDAKQRFGQLMKACETAPVAIEKHGKVHSYIVSSAHFNRTKSQDDALAARKLARVNQTVIEKDRLIRHQKIAFDLVTLPAVERDLLIKGAKAMVRRWRAEHLCSSDYIERWDQILNMKPREMAAAMVSDFDGWGPSLRQNSPLVGIHA